MQALDPARADKIAAIQARRKERGASDPLTRLSAVMDKAISAGAPVYINRPALSDPARLALAYCAAHSPVSKYGDTAGKRVVFFAWHEVAKAMGLPSSEPFTPIYDALQELHRAGLLAYHDHGPATYGSTSTIYLGE